jgi:hypothetical protein
MAGIPINDLPSTVGCQLTDQLPSQQGATTVKETLSQVMMLYEAQITQLTGMTGVIKSPTAIQDAYGHNVVSFSSVDPDANNYLTIQNGADSDVTLISDSSSNVNVPFTFKTKGTASFAFVCGNGTLGNDPIYIYPSGGFPANPGIIGISTLTDIRTWTFPDMSGNVLVAMQSTDGEITNNTKQIGFQSYIENDVPNVTGDGSAYFLSGLTSIYDNGNCFDDSTGFFTAPVAGTYIFSIIVQVYNLTVAATSSFCTMAVLGGTSPQGSHTLDQSNWGLVCNQTTKQYTVQGTFIATLNQGDQIATIISETASGTKTIGVSGGIDVTNISGRLLI